jgi:hypothetical protein
MKKKTKSVAGSVRKNGEKIENHVVVVLVDVVRSVCRQLLLRTAFQNAQHQPPILLQQRCKRLKQTDVVVRWCQRRIFVPPLMKHFDGVANSLDKEKQKLSSHALCGAERAEHLENERMLHWRLHHVQHLRYRVFPVLLPPLPPLPHRSSD